MTDCYSGIEQKWSPNKKLAALWIVKPNSPVAVMPLDCSRTGIGALVAPLKTTQTSAPSWSDSRKLSTLPVSILIEHASGAVRGREGGREGGGREGGREGGCNSN